MIKYIDPVKKLISIFEKGHPDINAQVDFVTGIDHKKFLGETCFADDGKIYVQVSINQTMIQIVDVLAHELAHVGAGPAADHGEKWQLEYDELNRRFNDEMEKEIEMEDAANE